MIEPLAGQVAEGDGALRVALANIEAIRCRCGEGARIAALAALARRVAPLLPEQARLVPADGDGVEISLPATTDGALLALAEDIHRVAGAEPVATPAGPIGLLPAIGAALGPHGASGILGAAAAEARAELRPGVSGIRIALSAPQAARRRADRLATLRTGLEALRDCRLSLAFQPIMMAGAGRRVAFHECLLRLRAPSGKPVAASVFLPDLLALGLGPALDRQALGMALETLAVHPRTRLSINIHPDTMADEAWIASLEETAANDPAMVERLIVEVTEEAASSAPEEAERFAARIRASGAALALDDFGSGHTGLARLRRLRADFLKIDRSLTAELPGTGDGAFWCRISVDIARHLEMATVAEGVATEVQAELLAELGIDLLQGDHTGIPRQSPMPDAANQRTARGI